MRATLALAAIFSCSQQVELTTNNQVDQQDKKWVGYYCNESCEDEEFRIYLKLETNFTVTPTGITGAFYDERGNLFRISSSTVDYSKGTAKFKAKSNVFKGTELYKSVYFDLPEGWVAATEDDKKINWLWGKYVKHTDFHK